MRWIVVALCLGGCVNPLRRPPPKPKPRFTEISMQLAHPVGDTTSNGVALHVVSAGELTGFDLGLRKTSDTMELALGVTMFGATEVLWDRGAVFLRGTINLLEWDRTNGDDRFGALGPLLEVGLGRKQLSGPCVVASVSRDFRFGYRDETFVGLGIGWCRIDSQ